MIRTSITVRQSLKRKMDSLDVNWSEVARQAIMKKLEEGESKLAEAAILNERLRRRAPEGWDSTLVIKQWRKAM